MTENQYGQVPKFMLIGVEKLTKHPLNEEIRFITADDFERLKKSVLEEKDTGYFNGRPCLVSEKGDVMEIMAGNNRFEAVKALGFTEIPCMVFTGLNAAEELRWLIKDNGQYAQFEHNAMSSFFDAPQLLDMGIHVPVVFSDAELETTDFSEKNQEINTEEFSDKMTLKLEYSADDFAAVKTALGKTGKTPEGFLFDSLAPFMP